MSEVTLFVCGTPKGPLCVVVGCHHNTEHTCQFNLKGKKTGEKCGKPICENHTKEGMCQAHWRYIEAVKANTSGIT